MCVCVSVCVCACVYVSLCAGVCLCLFSVFTNCEHKWNGAGNKLSKGQWIVSDL